MKRKLLILLALIYGTLMGQTTPQSLMITRIYGINSSWVGECAAGVISNISVTSRVNNYHSIYATGTGAWTAALSFSDASCSGPFTTFGAQAAITQLSNPPIAYANGYHPYIKITVTGSATVTYSAVKDFFLASSLASAVYPITLAQGGTGASSFTAHGVLIGEGSSALSVVAPGTSGCAIVSNGASADPTCQAIVNSFNTRTGTVVPTTGDYTAAQVTNAVDSTQAYTNPTWLAGISATICSTCVTTNTTQTITGAKTFNGGVYVGANEVIDANGFTAWGGASLNDSAALGYVVSNVDHTWTNQDNESRGVSSVVRAVRTTIDEGSNGWDQFGIAGVVVLGAMNMPSDPIYGSPYIRGQQKAVASELYYQTPISPYTANIGMNYLASLAQVSAGVTINTWAGLIVGQPGGYGGGGGHVVTGYGVWIENLQDAYSILTSANAAAIKIDGLGTFGRILWQHASAYSPSDGVLEFSATTSVRTASGVGFKVGGATANAGLAAGSLAIGAVTIIDGSLNISTTGYINTSGNFEISGVTAIDSSRNGSFADLGASGVTTLAGNLVVNVTGATQCLHVNSLGVVSGTGDDCGSGGGGGGGGGGNPFAVSVTANTALTSGAGFFVGTTGIIQCDSTGCPTISIGNVYNVDATGDVKTTGAHHVGSGTDASNGGYWLGTGQIISGTGAVTLLTVAGSGDQCLHADNAGLVTGTGSDCGVGAGGANASLNNLAGVSINTALLFQTGLDIGSATNPARDLYLADATAYGTNYFHITGTATGHRDLALPNFSTNIAGYQTGGWTNGDCVSIASTGELVDAGGPCTTGGGGGTVAAGTIGRLAVYTGTTTVGSIVAGGDLSFSTPNFTLASIISPGTCGSSTQSCVLTYDAKGRLTVVSTATISGGGGGGGNPFSGSVTANTSLAQYGGFYVNSTGVIECDAYGCGTISIGNVYNVTATGDIVTSGTHHVGAGAGSPGGYFVGASQVIDGSKNGTFGSVSGTSGTFTGSVTANYTQTNTAGYYIQFPSSNGVGYTGNIGIIQYAMGSPSVVNIGHVQDITAGGTIFTTGHLAATPASNIVALSLIGSTGGTADLMDVYTQGSALKAFSVDYLGQTNIIGNINQTATGSLNSFSGITRHLRAVAVVPAYNEVPLFVAGYTGGTSDLLQVYNQNGGTKEVSVDYLGALNVYGSMRVNTSLTNVAGLYINNTGVIQYATSGSHINIGNVYDVTATGTIYTSGHIGSAGGCRGCFGTTQSVVTGSRVLNFGYRAPSDTALFVMATVYCSGGGGSNAFTGPSSPSVQVGYSGVSTSGGTVPVSFMVPPGYYYEVASSCSLQVWTEWQ